MYNFDKYFELESELKRSINERKIDKEFQIKDEIRKLEIPRKFINRLKISQQKLTDLNIELLDEEVRKNPYLVDLIEEEKRKIEVYICKILES